MNEAEIQAFTKLLEVGGDQAVRLLLWWKILDMAQHVILAVGIITGVGWVVQRMIHTMGKYM